MTGSAILNELRRIEEAHGGLLKAPDVIESARNEASPLHSWFDWNDSIAAHNWRLVQARSLIRYAVTYIESDPNRTPIRAFVSLSPQRVEGGGYRAMVEVLQTPSMRQQMLEDALDEHLTYERRWAHLNELTKAFDEFRKLRNKQRKKRGAA